jgi:hypothetical protein
MLLESPRELQNYRLRAGLRAVKLLSFRIYMLELMRSIL